MKGTNILGTQVYAIGASALENLSWQGIVLYCLALGVAGVQMLTKSKEWNRRIGWIVVLVSLAGMLFGAYVALHGPTAVVTLSSKALKERLGSPYLYRKPINPQAYEADHENAFVIWIDNRWFQLNHDGQEWATFIERFPSTDREWFTPSTLEKKFPCGNRFPYSGVARAMLGISGQRYYWEWIGCRTSADLSHSVVKDVKGQQFENGYVIEGICIPPRSVVRKRLMLFNGGSWETENMDDHGHPEPPPLF